MEASNYEQKRPKNYGFASIKYIYIFFHAKKGKTFDQVMNLSWVHFQVHTFTDYPQWGPQPHIWIGNHPNLPFTYYTNYDCHARIEFISQHILCLFSLVFFVDYSWISLFRVKKMDSWLGASDDGSWTIFFYDFLHKDKWWWELNHIILYSQTKTLEWLTC